MKPAPFEYQAPTTLAPAAARTLRRVIRLDMRYLIETSETGLHARLIMLLAKESDPNQAWHKILLTVTCDTAPPMSAAIARNDRPSRRNIQ